MSRGLIGVFSRRLLQTPGLAALLAPWGVPVPAWRPQPAGRELAAYAGWGHRATADRPRNAAATHGLPYLALEDGFLRSAGLGVQGAAPWSMLVDDIGVHYDATHPSRLEGLIAEDLAPPGAALKLLELVRSQKLTKYNTTWSTNAPAAQRGRPVVYVLDQTRGDVSTKGGLADADTFEAMLRAAVEEHPGARVVVRTHPDVAAGRRRGYLAELAKRLEVELEGSGNWPSLAAAAAHVYTATSLGGFEALLAGASVTCFGLPFYAGWSLTDDRISCPRRRARPSLESLFAAAYWRYARYYDPVLEEACDGLVVARRLASARRAPPRRSLVVAGVQRWKRPLLRPFLAYEAASVSFLSTGPALTATRRDGGALAVWAPREPPGLAQAAGAVCVPLLRMEDGFLRSAGLGSDFRAAMSMVLDDLGIYYDVGRESRLERLLAETDFTPELLGEAAELRRRIAATSVGKYNLRDAEAVFQPDGRTVVLASGQVESDAAIRRGAPDIRRNLDLLRAVRQARPDARMLFKPHPEVESGHRSGRVEPHDACLHADEVLKGWSAAAAIQIADEVHVITSLLGFEALLRGRKVVTYGLPFYAGLGLTEDRLAWPRPRRRLTLDALVAATLILYPRYMDPRTGLGIDAQDAVTLLERSTTRPPDRLLQPRRLARWAALTLAG